MNNLTAVLLGAAFALVTICVQGAEHAEFPMLFAQGKGDQRQSPEVDQATVRRAAIRSIRLLEESSVIYLKEEQNCFSCHHQTMTLMVSKTAHRVGIEVDKENAERQLARVVEFYNSRRERFEPDDLKYPVTPLGYGLWGLDLGGHPPDDLTELLTSALLKVHKDLGHWKRRNFRPPAEASSFTSNYVAIRGLNRYGTKDQQEQIAARATAVRQWLDKTPARDTEDQVFRLRLAWELKVAPEKRKDFARRLQKEQHKNGGWAQKSGMKPDAYATGSVLVALQEVGEVTCDDALWRRGIRYLLQTQQDDGSWHVETRANPIQDYFESGFPHEEDQFISAYATGWSATALLLSLPEE